MSNMNFQPVLNVASAGMFAFLLYGAAASAEVRETPKAPTSRYTTKSVSSSSSGSITIEKVSYHQRLEQQVSNFYAALSERQTPFGSDLENLLLANLESLYED